MKNHSNLNVNLGTINEEGSYNSAEDEDFNDDDVSELSMDEYSFDTHTTAYCSSAHKAKACTHLTVRGDDTAFILRGAKRGFQYSNIYASPTALYIQLVCGRVARLPFKLLESYNGRIWSYKNCALYPTIAQGFNVFDCTLPSFFKHSVLPEDKLWKLISPSLSLSNCPLFVLLLSAYLCARTCVLYLSITSGFTAIGMLLSSFSNRSVPPILKSRTFAARLLQPLLHGRYCLHLGRSLSFGRTSFGRLLRHIAALGFLFNGRVIFTARDVSELPTGANHRVPVSAFVLRNRRFSDFSDFSGFSDFSAFWHFSAFGSSFRFFALLHFGSSF